MSDFKIESFKYGLDSRGDDLSSVSGTLTFAENCFVNAGGELEKIKAFDRFARLDMFDSNGDPAYYDLISTEAGLVSFTHALEFGASVTQGQPTLASATPAGIVRVQLKHPTLVNDSTENYDRTLHRLTAVTFSINFNGKSFACGQFSDGRKFLYYDGTLIQHSANGIVMENRTALSDLGNDLLRQLQAINWNGLANRTVVNLDSLTNVTVTATATYTNHGLSNGDRVEIAGATQTAYNGTFIIFGVAANTFQYTMPSDPGGAATGTPTATLLQNGSVLVKSPSSDFFSGIPSETSVSGQLGIKVVTTNYAGVAGTCAIASFQITGNAGTFTLTAPETAAGTGSVDLCGGAVAAVGSGPATATAIAKAVNDLTFVHGYTATTDTDKVFICANVAWGPVTFNLTVNVTTGTVGVIGGTGTIAVFINPPAIQRTGIISGNSVVQVNSLESAVASANGGTGTLTYAWSELSGTNSGIKISSPLSSITQFYIGSHEIGAPALIFPINTTGFFQCKVTDSLGAFGIAYCTVGFNLTSS